MKAVFFEEHGGPEVLRHGERPDPRPSALPLGEARRARQLLEDRAQFGKLVLVP